MRDEILQVKFGNLNPVPIEVEDELRRPVDLRLSSGTLTLYSCLDLEADPIEIPYLSTDVDSADPGNRLLLVIEPAAADLVPGRYLATVFALFPGAPSPQKYPPKGHSILVINPEPDR